jgi:Amt family ammonium transporter
MLAAAAMGLLAMPLPLRWMDGDGWLAQLGVVGIDPFPIAAAAFAFVGIKAIGPRLNKYHRDGSTSLIPAHSLPLAIIGGAVVTLALIGLTSLRTMRLDLSLAAVAAGGLATALATQVKYNRPDLGLIMTGLLGAAVAIYCLNVRPSPWWVLIGAIAGLVVPHFAVYIDTNLKLDDPPASLAIFGVGGALGMLAGGLLHAGDPMDRLTALGAAAIAIVAIAAWAAAVGWVVFGLLKRFTRLRVREADEFDGLDLAEHDIGAYPDFQQNTIRSFHMREA